MLNFFSDHFKSKIRFKLFPILAKVEQKFTQNWLKTRERYGIETLITQALNIKPSNTKNKKISKKIIFLTMNGYYSHIESLFALGLKQKGYNVEFILCDKFLPICEIKKKNQDYNWDYICMRCFTFGKKILESHGFSVKKVSEIKYNVDNYDNRWDQILDSSLFKHYKVGKYDSTDDDVKLKSELIKQSIQITQNIGKYILSQKPERVVMSHGIYSTWGPPFEMIKDQIPVLIYDRGRKINHMIFNWGKTGWYVDKEWENVKNIPLNKSQKNLIDKYLMSRIDHNADILKYNLGNLEDKNKTMERLKLDNDKPIFTLFTNVLWDAASAQKEIVFKDAVDWVIETIRWFIINKDKQLLIKIHPSENVIGTNQPFKKYIDSYFQNLPNNIKIIEPKEIINSWSILSITDVTLVHTTTAGLESVLVGKPCIVVSETNYRNKGFTIDVKSKEEYFSSINSYKKLYDQIEYHQELALRYAYLFFIRYQIPTDFFKSKGPDLAYLYNFDYLDDLFNNKSFKLIIDSIITKKDIFLKN